MNKSIIALTVAAVVLGGVFAYPRVAEAYRGDPAAKGPNYTAERHEAMERAFETNDYNAWKTLMNGRGRVTQVVNAQNFARFTQAHELSEQGKLQEAAQVRQELGLGLRNGSGQGSGMGRWSK